jgi:hypothetical protein
MKRNKRTTTLLAHEALTPLTEKILARMGPEGMAIRRRLLLHYHRLRAAEETRSQESEN